MIRIDRVITRGGDGGETSLGDGTRVAKDALRVEAYGTVDEANAAIGLLRLHATTDADADAMLARIQNDLFDIGADLCVPEQRAHEGAVATGERPAGIVREGEDGQGSGEDSDSQRGGRREGNRLRLTDTSSARLEAEVAAMNSAIPPLTSFILPGGTPGAAHAHLARTVVRRAERRVVALAHVEPVNPAVVRYLNRLSDHLFVLGRRLGDNGARDVLWVPGGA